MGLMKLTKYNLFLVSLFLCGSLLYGGGDGRTIEEGWRLRDRLVISYKGKKFDFQDIHENLRDIADKFGRSRNIALARFSFLVEEGGSVLRNGVKSSTAISRLFAATIEKATGKRSC